MRVLGVLVFLALAFLVCAFGARFADFEFWCGVCGARCLCVWLVWRVLCGWYALRVICVSLVLVWLAFSLFWQKSSISFASFSHLWL